MYPIKLTFNALPAVGVLLSLAGFYIPGFQSWYGEKSPEKKQAFMLLFLFAVSVVAAGGSVLGVLSIYPAQWQQAVWFALVDFCIAAIANAGTYKATDRINEAANRKIFRRQRQAKLDRQSNRG